MDIKAKFQFASEAVDSKTTTVKVKTIQLVDQTEIFLFPPELQSRDEHKLLFEHPVTKGVIKSLKTRNKFRNVIITLTKGEFQDTYLDNEGNVVFKEYYLEVAPTRIPPSPSSQNSNREKSIHSISKNMVLEKYNGKNFNAESWLKSFITECVRLDIQVNQYSEILRLFLEGSALDWYNIFLKTHTLSYSWEFWNNSFIDTFNQKSWTEIEYAYNYKYLNGSLLDFALKKRNMLIDADPELTNNSQINLIVISLPHFVRQRLEKDKLNKIDDLMSKLRQCERPISRLNSNANKESEKQNKSLDKHKGQCAREPCLYCKSIGFPNRFHSENLCRLKLANNNKFESRNDKVKLANNLEIQDVISLSAEAKNEY